MDKNTFIQLAKDAYRLTLLFPNKEPLRYKIRETADDIVACFIVKSNDFLGDLKARIELIDGFFEIALSQDWTSPARISEVQEGYLRAGCDLPGIEAPRYELEGKVENEKAEAAGLASLALMEPVAFEAPMIVSEIVAPLVVEADAKESLETDIEGKNEESAALSGSQIARQNRILEFLKTKGGAQVWEIQKIFPNVSKRTIRRDFHSMLKQGLIERTGERNMTAYKMKTTLS